MKFRTILNSLAGVAAFAVCSSASAADILCKIVTNEHMLVDNSYVSACVEAGVGNLGNGANDDFLNTLVGGGPGTYRDTYFDVGDGTFTTVDNPGGSGSTGTFSFNSSLWSQYTGLSIGFKFGTGNQPDEWFIYTLQDGVSSGNWKFIEVTASGGSGLSHISIYATGRCENGNCDGQEVPEPASLALLGLGLSGLALVRRRRRV